MGLLRRAAVAAVRGEPLSTQPDAVSQPARSRRIGLLRRSINALEKIRPGAPAARKPEPTPGQEGTTGAAPRLTIELANEESVQVQMPVRVEAPPAGAAPPPAAAFGRRLADVTEEIQTAITSLRAGMELPSRLFTALSSLLGIRKGAFLLYDAVRLVYAPWAQRGYDQTTRHRLRIPLGANEAWNALANGCPLLLSGAPALAAFQPYFSSREFASVEKLILVPFVADDKLVAVFLITDLESPLAEESELLECLTLAAETGAPRVQEARAARMAAPAAAGPPEAAPPRDDLARLLTFLSGKASAQLVALSLEDLSREVLAAHEDLDPFRLHEDLQFFLGSFLADVGRAIVVRPGRFTLALPDFDRAGLELFAHQLTMFLTGLFGDGHHGAPAFGLARILRAVSWPADGQDLRALVESLSS